MIFKLLLIALTAGIFQPTPVKAFWGLSAEQKEICKRRASYAKNSFSAKQTYETCLKNIQTEQKVREKYLKKQEKQKLLMNQCLDRIDYDKYGPEQEKLIKEKYKYSPQEGPVDLEKNEILKLRSSLFIEKNRCWMLCEGCAP